MKGSLTRQMFLMLFVSFISLVTVTIAILLMYFQYFYQTEKIERVVNNLNEFINSYEVDQWDDNQLYLNISTFNNSNGLDLWAYETYDYEYFESGESLMSNVEDAIVEDSESYYFITVANEGNYYDFMLESDEYQRIRNQEKLKNSDGLYVEGYVDDYGFIMVERINNTIIDSADRIEASVDIDGLESFKSQVVILTAQEIFNVDYDQIFPQYALTDEYYSVESDAIESSLILQDNVDILPEIVEKELDGVTYTITEIPYTDYKQVTFSKIVNINDKEMEFYTTMSLQPISEVIEVLLKYIPYYAAIALLLAIVISVVFSKRVSKPIVNITKAADSMAGMDLDVELEINRTDELGRLAVALNIMAGKLKESMDELVTKNKQLAYDFEIKRIQEEARKAFVANASHELKTPLGVIRSYTEAIRDGVKVEKQNYYMDVILDEINYMDQLIYEMLQLSKLDAGVMEYSFESFDIELMIDSITENFSMEMEDKGLELEVKKPMTLVWGDKDKIHQVLVNLISNAVKYSNPESTIKVESIDNCEQTVFYFYNECEPFEEEQLKKVWDRFYKVDESHNKREEGHGLGLAIVKSILEAHDCEYGVYNTLKGVCFYFGLKNVSET